MHSVRLAAAAALAVGLAACSGGGSPSAPPAANTGSNPSSGSNLPTAMVRLTFTIPGGSSTSANSRSPQFVSRSIQSAIATAYQTPGAPTNVTSIYLDLSSTSHICTANGNGSRSCSVFFPAPVGTDYFELDTYSGLPAPSSPCGGVGPGPSFTPDPPCTGVNGAELSSGTSGGPGNAGIVIGPGSGSTVNIGLQGIIIAFSGPQGVCRTGDPVALCNAVPNGGTASLFAISGLGNGVANTSVVLSSLAGTPVAEDANLDVSHSISGGTCTNGDLFANGIAITNIAGNKPTEGGGGAGGNFTSMALQPCNGGGFSNAPAQGFNVLFPNDQVQASYSGGGTAGNETAAGVPPYFAYISGSLQSFPGSVVAGNWTAPPATCIAATTCSAHPAPLGSGITGGSQPGHGAGNGNTDAQGGIEVNDVLAPLFAYVTDAASAGGASRDSSGSGATAHAVVNLASPGSTGIMYAAQFLLPTGGAYAAPALSAGCSSSASGTPQVAVTVGAPTDRTGGGGANPGWGRSWPLTAGNVASNGLGNAATSCVITLTDGFNSVQVWVANSVANGTIVVPYVPQNLYVANNGGNTVEQFATVPTGNVTSAPVTTIAGGNTSLRAPTGVTLDSSGNLYVANGWRDPFRAGSLNVYPPNANGNVTPQEEIIGLNCGFCDSTQLFIPLAIAVDSSGRIYALNIGNGQLNVYAPGAGFNASPIKVVTPNIGALTGMILDSLGRVYIVNAGPDTILVLSSYPNLNIINTISGGNTGLNSPQGIARDVGGRIYVTNSASNTVTVYAAGASGNATPVATIGGGLTGMNSPFGIALDAAGNVFVANNGNNTITVYAAPVGSVTSPPVATYGGGSTGLNAPYGLAIK
jgi:sugar lactone lactonase YvrE